MMQDLKLSHALDIISVLKSSDTKWDKSTLSPHLDELSETISAAGTKIDRIVMHERILFQLDMLNRCLQHLCYSLEPTMGDHFRLQLLWSATVKNSVDSLLKQLDGEITQIQLEVSSPIQDTYMIYLNDEIRKFTNSIETLLSDQNNHREDLDEAIGQFMSLVNDVSMSLRSSLINIVI